MHFTFADSITVQLPALTSVNMSSKDISGDAMEIETNLDDVEIDEDGNLRMAHPSPKTEDEMETPVNGSEMSVDEDGNLRIHSADKLLNSSK